MLFTSDIDLAPGGNPDAKDELFTMNQDGSSLQQFTHTSGGNNVAPRWISDGKTMAVRSDVNFVGNNQDHSLEVFRMDTDGSHLVEVPSSSSGFSAP